jgi:hypothetical protein
MSCSPNLLLYLPTKTGIPDKDKQEIKKWLEWGRQNERFLMTRKDLLNWPSSGKVDGSAHIIGDEGLIFLFNPEGNKLNAEFEITEADIGWQNKGKVVVEQEYPADISKICKYNTGDTVCWELEAETAVILRIKQIRS